MKRKLAIIGALSAIGRAILDCLAAHGFSSSEIYAVDSCQNVGTLLPFRERLIQTVAMETFDYTSVDLFFLCTPTILAEYRERMLNHGQYLIDCIGIMEEGPCVIPTLNIRALKGKRLISNPTGMTVTLAQILNPIHKAFHIQWACATALLPAGEFGPEAVQALVDQTRSLYTREDYSDGPFQKIQAFNLIPEIHPGLQYRTTKQLKNILHIPVHIATCLAPIFQGECYSLSLTTRHKCLLSEIEALFQYDNSCRIVQNITPYTTISTLDTACSDSIFLSHLDIIPYQTNTFHLWIVCDSLRTGAAQNAVYIAEYILS